MASDPGYISASAFLLSAHCARRLWLSRNAPELETSLPVAPYAHLPALLRQLFPDGVDAGADTPEAAVQATLDALGAGASTIYDATFLHNDVLVSIDVLQKRRGKWYAYESKCATSLKPAHMQDAALQYWVLLGEGLRLSANYIMHLNKAYVRSGPVDPAQLFLKVPVHKPVLAMLPAVQARIYKIKRVLAAAQAPEAERGSHCQKPGPCGFSDHCAAQEALQPAEEFGPMEIDLPALRAFLAPLRYPLTFMDFEAFQPPVPAYEGHWPFRQVPFQCSLHRQAAPGAPLEHFAFLAEGMEDPNRRFAESLLQAAGGDGPVMVYGKSFEHMILAQLAADFPDLADALYALKERVVDLGEPFLKKQVLIPALRGRSSLKTVLPALVPGLSYDGLAIADGSAANITFAHLRQTADPVQAAQMRAGLLAYCALDTLAMVRILERLRALAS